MSKFPTLNDSKILKSCFLILFAIGILYMIFLSRFSGWLIHTQDINFANLISVSVNYTNTCDVYYLKSQVTLH